MLRLDHNRALSQLSLKLGKPVGGIEKLVVWGNHSPTMYPDYRFATSDGASIGDAINDQEWNASTFIPTVGKRGAAIIEARGLSSAASAANAAIDHVRDWVLGSNGKWVTMGVPSDGSYGIPEGVIFGFPVTTENGQYTLVNDLPIDDFSQKYIDKTLAELEEERSGVSHLLGLSFSVTAVMKAPGIARRFLLRVAGRMSALSGQAFRLQCGLHIGIGQHALHKRL